MSFQPEVDSYLLNTHTIMNSNNHRLFIIDDNQLLVADLRIYLESVFGETLTISTFNSGESALAKVDNETHIVILDYDLPGENGNEILKSIKAINPKTEVIMLTTNEDIKTAIDAFRNGAADYVIKGAKAEKKIQSLIYRILTYPIHLLTREFKVSKYVAIFILTFISMGLCVLVWKLVN